MVSDIRMLSADLLEVGVLLPWREVYLAVNKCFGGCRGSLHCNKSVSLLMGSSFNVMANDKRSDFGRCVPATFSKIYILLFTCHCA